jgi:hypothetical protein
MNGAIARIILRYGVGAVIGMEAAQALAGDPDIVLVLAGGVGVAIEAAYTIAKRRGWAL